MNFGNISAAEISWPKVIKVASGEITVYQPQPETLEGTTLSGRAAVSAKHKDSKRPIFGAIWITSTLEVDRSTRIAVLNDIKIPNIRFLDEIDSATVVKITKLIEEEMPKWELEISMDDLIATLESTTTASNNNFKHDDPEIIIAYKPSIEKTVRPSTRPATGVGTSRPVTQPGYNKSELNRQSVNRNRGAARTNNFSNYSGSGGGARAMPANRGGGGARRR
jgi:hypothetical protein